MFWCNGGCVEKPNSKVCCESYDHAWCKIRSPGEECDLTTKNKTPEDKTCCENTDYKGLWCETGPNALTCRLDRIAKDFECCSDNSGHWCSSRSLCFLKNIISDPCCSELGGK